MPTISKRETRTAQTAYLAQVRVAGLGPVAKTFSDPKAALAWRAGTSRRCCASSVSAAPCRADVATLTVGALVLEFLADPETTRLRYFDDLHRLCAWWIQHYGTVRAVEFGVLQIRGGREALRNCRGPATVNRYLSALRSAWNWARWAGLLPNDRLFPSRVMLSEPKGRTRFLSDDELAALLAAARERSPLMYAAIVTSIATGVRQGELLRLDWSDIDFARQTLRIRESKNDEARAIHLPPSASEALRGLQSAKVRAIGAVFITDNGLRVRKSTLEARWKRLATASASRT